jgi:hypothetical protein
MIPSGCDVPVGMCELEAVPGPDDFEVFIRATIQHIKLGIRVDHLVSERGICIFKPEVCREEGPRDPGIHVDEPLACLSITVNVLGGGGQCLAVLALGIPKLLVGALHREGLIIDEREWPIWMLRSVLQVQRRVLKLEVVVEGFEFPVAHQERQPIVR